MGGPGQRSFRAPASVSPAGTLGYSYGSLSLDKRLFKASLFDMYAGGCSEVEAAQVGIRLYRLALSEAKTDPSALHTEVVTAAKLGAHPFLAKVLGACVRPQGEGLFQLLLLQDKPFTRSLSVAPQAHLPQKLLYALQASLALAALHDHPGGVPLVHGELCTSNIFLGPAAFAAATPSSSFSAALQNTAGGGGSGPGASLAQVARLTWGLQRVHRAYEAALGGGEGSLDCSLYYRAPELLGGKAKRAGGGWALSGLWGSGDGSGGGSGGGGSGKPTPASDCYALGICVWEILTGERAFDAEGVEEGDVCARIRDGTLRPPLTSLPPATPGSIAKLLGALWGHKPSARPSAREAAEVLSRALEKLGGGGTTSALTTCLAADREARGAWKAQAAGAGSSSRGGGGGGVGFSAAAVGGGSFRGGSAAATGKAAFAPPLAPPPPAATSLALVRYEDCDDDELPMGKASAEAAFSSRYAKLLQQSSNSSSNSSGSGSGSGSAPGLSARGGGSSSSVWGAAAAGSSRSFSSSTPSFPPPPPGTTTYHPSAPFEPTKPSSSDGGSLSGAHVVLSPIWTINPPEWDHTRQGIPPELDEVMLPLPPSCAHNVVAAVVVPFYTEGGYALRRGLEALALQLSDMKHYSEAVEGGAPPEIHVFAIADGWKRGETPILSDSMFAELLDVFGPTFPADTLLEYMEGPEGGGGDAAAAGALPHHVLVQFAAGGGEHLCPISLDCSWAMGMKARAKVLNGTAMARLRSAGSRRRGAGDEGGVPAPPSLFSRRGGSRRGGRGESRPLLSAGEEDEEAAAGGGGAGRGEKGWGWRSSTSSPTHKIFFSLLIKRNNGKKHHSHLWFFEALAPVTALRAGPAFKYLYATDCGTLYAPYCLQELMLHMEDHPVAAAVTGHQRIMAKEDQLDPGDPEVEGWGAASLRSIQAFDFESGLCVFNGMHAFAGFLPVVPGPCGLFRYKAISPAILAKVRAICGSAAEDDGLVISNLKIAEDRILSYLLVLCEDPETRQRWQTHWVPSTTCVLSRAPPPPRCTLSPLFSHFVGYLFLSHTLSCLSRPCPTPLRSLPPPPPPSAPTHPHTNTRPPCVCAGFSSRLRAL